MLETPPSCAVNRAVIVVLIGELSPADFVCDGMAAVAIKVLISSIDVVEKLDKRHRHVE